MSYNLILIRKNGSQKRLLEGLTKSNAEICVRNLRSLDKGRKFQYRAEL